MYWHVRDAALWLQWEVLRLDKHVIEITESAPASQVRLTTTWTQEVGSGLHEAVKSRTFDWMNDSHALTCPREWTLVWGWWYTGTPKNGCIRHSSAVSATTHSCPVSISQTVIYKHSAAGRLWVLWICDWIRGWSHHSVKKSGLQQSWRL